jgi:kinesin family protein 13
MLGSSATAESRGIIPRLCDALFTGIDERKAAAANGDWAAKVEVSYMEIYNERVHDLLDPRRLQQGQPQQPQQPQQQPAGLRVREHSVLGPYVDGLSQLAVISYQVGLLFPFHGIFSVFMVGLDLDKR